MEAISDESDGTYDRWMQSMGFEPTAYKDINVDGDNDETIHVYSIQNGIGILSDSDVTVCVWTINGQLLENFNLKAGTRKEIVLPRGVYVVNGEKVMVE